MYKNTSGTKQEQKSSTLPRNSPIEKRAKQLRQCGLGKRPYKASSFTKEEEEVLWKAENLGSKTPHALISTMWWL